MTDTGSIATYCTNGIEVILRGDAEREIVGTMAATEPKTAQAMVAQAHYWGDPRLSGTSIAGEVWQERLRQIAKRGLQERGSGTSAEQWHELELAAKRDHDARIAIGELTWLDILKEEVYEAFAEEDPEKLEVELIQVMAVAASWIQDLRRRGDQAP